MGRLSVQERLRLLGQGWFPRSGCGRKMVANSSQGVTSSRSMNTCAAMGSGRQAENLSWLSHWGVGGMLDKRAGRSRGARQALILLLLC